MSSDKNASMPKIMTWSDVEKEYPKLSADFLNLNIEINCCCGIENKIAKKMIASAKIVKLIELGYGGVVSKDEWKNAIEIWYIDFDKDNNPLVCLRGLADSNKICPFIAFHTQQQAEEFMSYPENRALVEQYYML